ncbi:type IV pilin N-terminal domain-containing protein [Halomicroarcula sp. GCM10025709]|uniref:type IV pilin N-terminal domain-containing protein n=1 Tax=Haloarcula TaxID=2237 RepID=UPI0024C276A4|nr:type IV pilin N-terminal domain-containing protein [Halomicroarcula sp. YJ-61-S]
MDLKQLFNDDDAVSPVIGVILMVAITVILAAVIASFVLGLGDQTQSTTPQASFSFDYNENETDRGQLTITHDGGDTITASELYLRGSGFTSSSDVVGDADFKTSGGAWGNSSGAAYGSNSDISAGQSVIASLNDDYEVRVVYESAEGDSSATLGQDSGPEA